MFLHPQVGKGYSRHHTLQNEEVTMWWYASVKYPTEITICHVCHLKTRGSIFLCKFLLKSAPSVSLPFEVVWNVKILLNFLKNALFHRMTVMSSI